MIPLLRTLLTCLVVSLTAISVTVSESPLVGFAFINSEIESLPGINVAEDCYNSRDDDGDNLTDYLDINDCFSATITNSSNITNGNNNRTTNSTNLLS